MRYNPLLSMWRDGCHWVGRFVYSLRLQCQDRERCWSIYHYSDECESQQQQSSCFQVSEGNVWLCLVQIQDEKHYSWPLRTTPEQTMFSSDVCWREELVYLFARNNISCFMSFLSPLMMIWLQSMVEQSWRDAWDQNWIPRSLLVLALKGLLGIV